MVNQPVVEVWNNRNPKKMEVTCHGMPQTSKYLRGCVQIEAKYSELINLVFEFLRISAARMFWYLIFRGNETAQEHLIIDGWYVGIFSQV